jgi:ribosomal protein L40E
MHRDSTWIALAIGFALVTGAGNGAAAEPQYVGAKKCRTCHKKELIGNQWGAWLEGDHAKAYETLKQEEALKIARERGLAQPPHEAEECLKCHATAFGLEPAQLAKGKPLEVSDGVQCESCHGPGSKYRKKKIMSNRDKAVAAGLWNPGEDEELCTTCHNDESPTWDPAEGFDYEEAKAEIAHPIPEDVKGKYLEIEKQRKAEKRAGGEPEEEEEED